MFAFFFCYFKIGFDFTFDLSRVQRSSFVQLVCYICMWMSNRSYGALKSFVCFEFDSFDLNQMKKTDFSLFDQSQINFTCNASRFAFRTSKRPEGKRYCCVLTNLRASYLMLALSHACSATERERQRERGRERENDR